MAEKLNTAGKKDGIRADVLRALINKCDEMRSDMDEARGELGSAVKDAEETHGINRKAFKLAMSLMRMEETKRSDFLRSLDDYRAKLELNPLPDMFEEGDEAQRRAAQSEKQAQDDQAAENGKKIAKGIKSLDAVH
ncbi:hypothetical protein MEX01_48550 [Methylorubrum extorquens]|uniref:hypothetical protein n=1 Tax=Methylorubrum extorquens TaxID=408 RepID=UPI00116F1993|nr:hypothetical protein [Methylorubrum extorquens]GEL44264.1 hypothetical protein MEX01_48550 [Methylorubrum extorquens]